MYFAKQRLNESFIRTPVKQQRMIPNRYFFTILFACLLASIQTARAQCTSNAGGLNAAPVFGCENTSFSVIHNGNQVLDGDDILLFVAYTGSAPNAGTVFASSATGTFAWQPAFLANSPFKVAAVAGNNAGGTVDWNDPCLSVSAPVTVTYMTTPVLNIPPVATLTCSATSISINASSNQQNLTYLWSNNVTTPTVIVQQPGTYTVTVTNQGGCSATATIVVTQDITPPGADAGPNVTLTCALTSTFLQGVSFTPGVVFTWIGPNGFTSTQQNPPVTQPGAYTLIVTSPANGCTSTDQAVVSADIVSPAVSAGSDQGIPCGGGAITLAAAASPGAVFSWAGPGGFTSNAQNPVVSAPGTYTVTATGVNGCTGTDEVTVYPGPLISQQNFTVTPITCNGLSNGAISLTTLPAGVVLPATYQWSGPGGFISTQQNITGIPAGIYSLTLTDATACSYVAPAVVAIQPAPLTVSGVNISPSCQGPGSGSISIAVAGGTPPYLFAWSTGATGPSVGNLSPGAYIVTITDAMGCTAVSQPLVVTIPPALSVSVQIANSHCSNNGSIVLTPVIPNTMLSFQWSGPNGFTANTPFITDLAEGTYTVVVTDMAGGCSATYTYQILNMSDACGVLEGYAVQDTTDNCLADPGEPGLAGWLVRAEGAAGTFYGVTGADGRYLIGVPLGTYAVTAILPNSLWELCAPGNPVTLDIVNDTIAGGDIPVKKSQNCPALGVHIGTNVLRRCFSNNYYYVDYCNDGTAPAENAYIIVTLDPFITPLSASIPYTNLGNNVLRFNIGDVGIGDCGNFNLKVQISCNAALGQMHCTEAHIYPDSACVPVSAQWSGASLHMTSQCDADSVRFLIQNVGTGNMTSAVDYIVVEDAVMLMTGQIQLDAGKQITLSFPANGSTWHVEVEQVPFHPGNSQPALSVEGCSTTTSFSTGFANQFPLNDADPWIDIDCTANIGSYDPNDKQGIPLGYGAAHYIRPGTPVEYLIRFQNTGTDTAFNVRVVDTLSAWLDPATIQPGPASHPYRFDLSGRGIATFLFDNILLPDSNANQAASNGFVKFSILPRADAPLETVIENNAAIYFDFNEPVITNTVFHRLGENFLVGTWQPHVPGAIVKVTPNPFADETTLEVNGLRKSAPLQLQVFDLQGVVIREMETPGAFFTLKKGDWPAGVYFFAIRQEGKLVGSGKLVVK